MSVATSASSPHSHTPRSSRPSTTPSVRPTIPGPIPGSVGQAMPPLMTPSISMARPPSSTKVRSPSPNYFGFQASSNALPVSTYAGQNGQHTRNNWSPPSSTVRSTAAASPSIVPLDQNPEFAAFRRQSEGMGRAFSLASLHNYSQNVLPTTTVADDRKWPNNAGGTPTRLKSDHKIKSPPRPGPYVLDPDAASLGRSPKRHLSSDSSTFPAEARKASPATHGPTEPTIANGELAASPEELTHPPLFALKPPSFSIPSKPRAATVPVPTNGNTSLVPPQRVVTLLEAHPEQILILDLRVSTQYAKSRITGALNLCIPTTLMKRPSFTVEKLAETFKSEDQRGKFDNWRSTKYIIVYDAAASQMKDAAICLNTIKKFDSEGYTGITYVVQGGFADFAAKFPKYVDKGCGSMSGGPPKLNLSGQDEPLPVTGGCPMPMTKQAANPFFGNIRQNMDLIGGVGQMALKKPSNINQASTSDLPDWLRTAADDGNKGKVVSDYFLHIEKREQKRMQDALSGGVSYGTPSAETPSSVRIAGIEKGSKNRYNNIWPFEHTRVKLEGVPDHGCDYVNANHVKSSLSNKRYIATQGPIPATFADFWNMVWQQDVRVLVMLTAEKEGNQVKAHNYWSEGTYGPFNLSLLSERKATLDLAKISRHRARSSLDRERKSSESNGRPSLESTSRKPSLDASKPNIIRNDSKGDPSTLAQIAPNAPAGEEPFVTVRKFTLSHSNEPFEPLREITHLQYSSWPDFGAPAHPAHLLGLVEQTDAVVRSLTHAKRDEPEPEGSRQVLVHCSAGCGRTGTFCTVDTVIDVLKRQRRERERERERKHTELDREATPMDLDSKSPQKEGHGRLSSPFKSAFGSSGPANGVSGSDPTNPFFGDGVKGMEAVDRQLEKEEKEREWDIDGNWLLKDGTDLIEKTVEDFRHQRLSMVQSLRQYVLCYESVMEWLVGEGGE
ncbi:Tyrosine-protein phosphatase non-receptor type 1 [Sphaceloma murrayae]|uniref:protein-tyrosine-phosphatase n=1 Tax=Sphaceloma murrayae TaxID=2082308 RepID=A0A2K1QKR7_9PEZI|nr:Tyrosine-protein phosphatase non-receptor type 1 [Sphaceloma murrayae]